MWELYCEESWAPKNLSFWTVVLEKTLESPLDCKEIQPVCSKGDQSWVFIGRNDAKAETLVLWPPHAKSWLTGRDSDAGEDWGQEEKGTTEDEMAGWHHLTQWTWVWVNSGSWWWTGRPGVLRFLRSQRVGHDWATELNWAETRGPERWIGRCLLSKSSWFYGSRKLLSGQGLGARCTERPILQHWLVRKEKAYLKVRRQGDRKSSSELSPRSGI